MSLLMSSFNRRQPLATPSVPGGTVSSYDISSWIGGLTLPTVSDQTISSYDVNSLMRGLAFPDHSDYLTSFEEVMTMTMVYNIEDCSDMNVGEGVTQVYPSSVSHVKLKLCSKNTDSPLIKLIVFR